MTVMQPLGLFCLTPCSGFAGGGMSTHGAFPTSVPVPSPSTLPRSGSPRGDSIMTSEQHFPGLAPSAIPNLQGMEAVSCNGLFFSLCKVEAYDPLHSIFLLLRWGEVEGCDILLTTLWVPFHFLNTACASSACWHFPMTKLWPHRLDVLSAQCLGLGQERGAEAFGNKWVQWWEGVREGSWRLWWLNLHILCISKGRGLRWETSDSPAPGPLVWLLHRTRCSISINPRLNLWAPHLLLSFYTFSMAWFLHSILF